MIISSSVGQLSFACSRVLSAVRHHGFQFAWKVLSDKRPASFIPLTDFMQGAREAFSFFNDKLSSDRSQLKDVTSAELWTMIQEMPPTKPIHLSLSSESDVTEIENPLCQTEAFITALSLPSSFPAPIAADSDSDRESSTNDDELLDPQKLGVRVRFYSKVPGGRRIDELEFESQWDGTKGLGEWKITSIR